MKTSRQPKSQNKKQQRGIVLIIVVSLLALFILLGVTFALVSSAYLQGSKIDSNVDRTGDLPEAEADLIFQQILSETFVRPSPYYRSSLQGQGLLSDLYGTDGFTAYVYALPLAPSTQPRTWNPANQGQILQFYANDVVFPPQAEQPFERTSVSFHSAPDYYTGRVLTFITGNLAGKSARIVHYAPAVPANSATNPPTPKIFPTLYVEMPKHDTTVGVMPSGNQNFGDKFVINGAPFNGTGYGYNSGATDMSFQVPLPTGLTYTGTAYAALLPHIAGYDQYDVFPYVSAGGMDESYDAPDF